ncbi:MAG: hypothetical protein RIR53_1863 [Bacteroidota bacterium]
MKTRLFATLALCATLAMTAATATPTSSGSVPSPLASSQSPEQKNMNSKFDSTSYAIGLQMGKSLVEQGIEFNVDDLAAGIRDFKAGSPKLTQEQIQTILSALQEANMKRFQAEQAKAGEENGKKGEAFLAENKKDPAVKVTASGLQYKVIKEGTGNKPSKANTVKVHYTGKLIDGTVFDSSVERGEPIEFPLANVIAGWTEGVQLMPVGSKYMLYIPSNLAYGTNGYGQTIGPNSTLIFEVELLEITK